MATVTRTNKKTGETQTVEVWDYKVFTVLAHVQDWDGFLPATYQQVSAGTWTWETEEDTFVLSAPAYEAKGIVQTDIAISEEA